MSKLRLKISMSLDGFVAGPSQSIDAPLGIGGERLQLVRTVSMPAVTHLKFARS